MKRSLFLCAALSAYCLVLTGCLAPASTPEAYEAIDPLVVILGGEEKAAAFKNTPPATLERLNAALASPEISATNRADALLYRGCVFAARNQTRLAMSDWTELVQDPHTPADTKAVALTLRGIGYRGMGKDDLAIQEFAQVIQIPDAPGRIKAIALLDRGYIYSKNVGFEPAIKEYTAALALPHVPDDVQAIILNIRGLTYARNMQMDLALKDLNRVQELPNASPRLKQTAKETQNRIWSEAFGFGQSSFPPHF